MVIYKSIYQLNEAAKMLTITEDELWMLIQEGRLCYVMIREKPLIRGKDLESFIDKLTCL